MPPHTTLQHLTAELQRFGPAPPQFATERRHTTGLAGLDALLPEGGLLPGTLVECLTPGGGTGAETLVLALLASRVAHSSGVAVLIDPRRSFQPRAGPEGRAHGGCWLDRLIVLHPGGERDTLWSWEQSLRCPEAGVVAGRVDRLSAAAYRRLKLASEAGGGVGWLLREASVRGQPSWADLRLQVQPVSRDWSAQTGTCAVRVLNVELLHCRGRFAERSALVELDDETGLMRLVPRVAPATIGRRVVGA